MVRSAAAVLTLLILPGLARGQELATGPQGTHEVVRGETLWGLAGRYLGDPFRWPLIYEANQDKIQDPHWIYPGQVFGIPGLDAAAAAVPSGGAEVTDVSVMVTPVDEAAAPAVQMTSSLPPCPAPNGRTVFYPGGEAERGCRLVVPSPEERSTFYPRFEEEEGGVSVSEETLWPAVPRGLVYSAPWLAPLGAEAPSLGTIHRLADAWSQRLTPDRASAYQKVHLSILPGASLAVGDVLQSFRVLRAWEGLGQVVLPSGILTVTQVEEGGVVAAVAAEFDRVKAGDALRRVPSYTLRPGVHPDPVESNVVATVLGFPVDRELHGFGSYAFLNVGEREGVVVGDEFVARTGGDEGFAGDVAVRLQVVRVDGAVSTARVITLNEPILRNGTQARLVGKMR